MTFIFEIKKFWRIVTFELFPSRDATRRERGYRAKNCDSTTGFQPWQRRMIATGSENQGANWRDLPEYIGWSLSSGREIQVELGQTIASRELSGRIKGIMKPSSSDPRSFDELLPQIRQKRLQTPERLSGIVRTLVRFHDPLARFLVRTRVSAIQLTVVWMLVSLVSFAVSAYGTPWTFVLGALLLYAAIIIDLCDGEVGRYRALSMTPIEDLTTFVNGLYLDRVFHFISSQLWPIALAFGLYQMHGRPWALVACVPWLLSINIHRLKPYLEGYLVNQFRERIQALAADDRLHGLPDREHINDWLIVRTFWYLSTLIRNGKRTNFVVLVAALADCAIWWSWEPAAAQVLHVTFLGLGMAALVIEAFTVFGNVFVGTLVRRVCAVSLPDGWDQRK